MSDTVKRVSWLVLIGICLIYVMLKMACEPVHARDNYAPGDTVKLSVARMDSFFNGTDEVAGETFKVFRWLGVVPDSVGLFTEAAVSDSGTAGFYWIIPGSNADGEYFGSWTGTITTRTPVMTFNFTVGSTIETIQTVVDDINNDIGSPSTTIAGDIDAVETLANNAMKAVWTANGNVSADAGNSTLQFEADDLSFTADDNINGQWVTFWSGDNTWVTRRITDWDQSTKIITVRDPLPAIPSAGDDITICKAIDVMTEYLGQHGPYVVNLYFFDNTDTTAIQDVWLRIMDEDQLGTILITTTNGSGLATVALEADTVQVIASKQGSYTFTVPTPVYVTGAMTDTIWGTPFDAGSPDSANVTKIEGWLRALDGSNSGDVILKFSVLPGTGEDLGSPGTDPSLFIMRQAVACTSLATGYFEIMLFSAEDLLPEGGSVGTVRYRVDVSKRVRIGHFVGESDTIYVPTILDTYNYWDDALRP